MQACQGGCDFCAKLPETDGMDLDSALHELGMLSSITDSRKQFLQERKKSTSEPSTSLPFNEPMPRPFNEPVMIPFNEPIPNFQGRGFHILQVDPNYVTGFSADLPVTMTTSKSDSSFDVNVSSKIPCSDETTPVLDPKKKGCFCQNDSCCLSDCTPKPHRKMMRHSLLRKGRYKRYLKPYEVPWRLHNSLPEAEMHSQEHSRSNGSSPVKAPNGGPLTRSRSLNNLEAARARLADIFEEPHFSNSADRQEIEKVSQRIENLHFAEKT